VCSTAMSDITANGWVPSHQHSEGTSAGVMRSGPPGFEAWGMSNGWKMRVRSDEVPATGAGITVSSSSQVEGAVALHAACPGTQCKTGRLSGGMAFGDSVPACGLASSVIGRVRYRRGVGRARMPLRGDRQTVATMWSRDVRGEAAADERGVTSKSQRRRVGYDGG
jgi:hypothetical protein